MRSNSWAQSRVDLQIWMSKRLVPSRLKAQGSRLKAQGSKVENLILLGGSNGVRNIISSQRL